jgi:iron(III) transport system permease protein
VIRREIRERAAGRKPFRHRGDPGRGWLWLLIAATALVVLPPFFYLVSSSFMVPLPGFRTAAGLDNYRRVIELSGSDLWGVTLAFALGSSLVAIVLGGTSAWLLARTNVPFRQVVLVGAFLSLSVPLIVKGIGWILLLGPNNGLINMWLRSALGLESTPIELFSLGGMIFVEGLLWTPVALLLALPPLGAIDPALEEAASMCGASRWQTILRVTLPLARPAILAVLLLSFIRALEAFEVPLLIGIPGGVITVTTALYQSVHSGFVPRYGEASAYAVLLTVAVLPPLALYYRATRLAARFATVTGKGFRPARIDLGAWRYPCALWILIVPLSFGAPLLLMAWASLLPLYTSPSVADFAQLSLRNYFAVATRGDTVSGLWNSLLVGAGAAGAVAAAALVMSFMVVRRREKVRCLLDLMASLPLVFPGIVLGIAVLVQFLNLRFIPIYGTVWIVMFALAVKFLPYGMRFCYSSLLSIDRQLEESAQLCGAGAFKVLRSIVRPLILPAILATAIYVFVNAVRDLSTAVLLTGANNAIVSVVILDLWNNGEVPQLAALSILIAAGTGALGALFMKLSRRHGYRV